MDNRVKIPLLSVGVLAAVFIFSILLNKPAKNSDETNSKNIQAETDLVLPGFKTDNLTLSFDKPVNIQDVTMSVSDYLLDDEAPVTEEDLYKFLPDYLHDLTNDESVVDDAPDNDSIISESERIVSVNHNQIDDLPASSLNDWNLILVNKQNYVPEDYELKLVDMNGNMKVDERVAGPLAEMLIDARKDNVDLMICSAYRSYDRQTSLFNNKINKLMNAGMSYYEAYKVGSYSVTIPGTSEHQLGMALDIVTPSYTSLDEGFADTEAGKWLRDNAPRYGFILRYLEGKEHITGITFEPWHYRYVGIDNAKYMTEKGITLEEYLELISENK